ncbi:MAG: type III pantothenate kinase [Rhodospirillaceae bacterium]|jgi:type III pantothenate kinase|nr:type III pantothenate kinase [Rhodospirillaceae bacterium]MBT4219944.1 type III pantothenate kinase [Rhodospirillaceae bacterium]MBT4464148.1 type III pantothenate kinase [Rhodospirillaceae bacterium]MBT5013320.1 type III pantothenate kinase [Rhodospirillaceae bacterium]MBT5309413.1 type III pantothenate kinase [Rhodospirillaceae bacterium]
MLLAIDAGNTNTVFAVFDAEGKVLGEWRSSSESERTSDEYGVWLMQLLDLDGIERDSITASIIASVVPATLHSLKTLCRDYFKSEPLIIGEAGVDLGLEVLLDKPDEVGADRLVNAVSAHAAYGGPMIIVDFGTATTFDVIDGDGNYAGGVIAPGINLSLEALHMAAAQLPRVAVERPDAVIGKGTVGAMQSGIYWGYVSMIEGIVARIQDEFGADMRVIATGGLAALFAGSMELIEAADAELTLRGLYAIHRLNGGK